MVFVLPCRKITPGLMPPGSPGTYRKKSSSLELPAALQQLPRPHRPSLADTKMAEDKPWPNTKEDYDLREVIGKLILMHVVPEAF